MLARPIWHAKNRRSKPKCSSDRDTLFIVLYYLNRTCSFHFKCVSIDSFCNEAFVVWLLFILFLKQDASQRIISILQTHSFKGVQKNMLKVWHFTKNKICRRCFDNILQKLFRTKIFKNSNGQILLIVVLLFGLWLNLQMERVD